MHGLGARQASIDGHLERARRCLAASQHCASDDTDNASHPYEQQQQHGRRIAAKILHLRNVIAALTPVPATTELDQFSVFDRFRASVETLWSDHREHRARDGTEDLQSHLHQVRVDPSASHRSLGYSSPSTPRHRRAGSSRV